MTTATRRGILAVVTVVALVAIGLGLGAAVDAFGPAAGATDAFGSDADAADAGSRADAAERDATMAWLARGLLVLAVAWVVIGMLSARTRLVRRPGAAAARASWLASSRPWRARESTLGMLELDRGLLLVIPTGLLVATRAVQASFLAWADLAILLGAWLAFAAVVRLCLWRLSPWPVIAAVGGVVVLRCIVTLALLSFNGPSGYWSVLSAEPVLRTIFIAVAFALLVWLFTAGGWALSTQVGPRRATGFMLAGIGGGLAVPALVVGAVGLEAVLAHSGDASGLLPWGLVRVVGVTTFTEIPTGAPWFVAAVGGVVLVVGVLLAMPWRRRTEASAS